MDINRIAQKFDDMKSSAYKHSYMQITDNSEVVIDRCNGVIAYDENQIRLQLVNNALFITGQNMKMFNFSNEGVIVEGKIHSLEFGEKA
ncbi:MAG: YabP/YqfC family sporulation protein [Oscillospiraceae bacterium]|nr:YabP/YqfC family sporulation protein [Oscillospiraceae bacterium]